MPPTSGLIAMRINQEFGPPGAHHGPFKSERGCLLYEIHYYDESKK